MEDTQYQVPRAVQAGAKLINRDHIFAMVAGLGTPMNNALFKDQFDAGVPNLFPLSAARSMYEPFHKLKFYGAASYVDQVRAGIQYFVSKKGKKALCAMYQDTDFGKEVLDGVQMQAEKLKLKVVETVTHKPTDQDFTAQITKLKAAGCDLVVMGTIVRDSIVPYATARKMGWTDVDFLGSAAAYDLFVAAAQGGVTEGFYAMGLTAMPYRDTLSPAAQAVVRPLQGPLQGRPQHRRDLRPRGRGPHRDRAREGGRRAHHRQLRAGHGVDPRLPRHLQRPRGELRPRQAPGRRLLVPRGGEGRALDAPDRPAALLSRAPGRRRGRERPPPSPGGSGVPPLLLQQAQQVLPVAVLLHRLRDAPDVVRGDEAHALGDLLDARDLEPLPLLDGLDEVRRLQQRVVGAGVEPGDAAPEPLDVQLAPLEVRAVDVGDLELAARRRA